MYGGKFGFVFYFSIQFETFRFDVYSIGYIFNDVRISILEKGQQLLINTDPGFLLPRL